MNRANICIDSTSSSQCSCEFLPGLGLNITRLNSGTFQPEILLAGPQSGIPNELHIILEGGRYKLYSPQASGGASGPLAGDVTGPITATVVGRINGIPVQVPTVSDNGYFLTYVDDGINPPSFQLIAASVGNELARTKNVSAAFTVDPATDCKVFVDTNAGDVAGILNTPAIGEVRSFRIINTGTTGFAVSLTPVSGTINGAASFGFNGPAAYWIDFDGTNWYAY